MIYTLPPRPFRAPGRGLPHFTFKKCSNFAQLLNTVLSYHTNLHQAIDNLSRSCYCIGVHKPDTKCDEQDVPARTPLSESRRRWKRGSKEPAGDPLQAASVKSLRSSLAPAGSPPLSQGAWYRPWALPRQSGRPFGGKQSGNAEHSAFVFASSCRTVCRGGGFFHPLAAGFGQNIL